MFNDISMDLVQLAFVTGLGFGAIYVLIAMSYTLVLAASGVFNFALASVVMGGAVATFVLRERVGLPLLVALRSEEHTSELQSLMRMSDAVFCLQIKKKN